MLTTVLAAVSSETTAIIAGSAAIGGSLVGGLVTGGFNVFNEKKRQSFARETERLQREHDDARHLLEVRGAAREMRVVFRQNEVILKLHAELGFWWDNSTIAPRTYDLAESRLLVAANTHGTEWDEIETGERKVRFVIESRNFSIAIGEDRIGAAESPVPDGENPLTFSWSDDVEGESRNALEVAAAAQQAASSALARLCA